MCGFSLKTDGMDGSRAHRLVGVCLRLLQQMGQGSLESSAFFFILESLPENHGASLKSHDVEEEP